ncbi:cytochrome c biogenesis protein CcsA [Luteolibacter sp. SL250]|uniref:cytochrome c biogenesis protein CcsA n=1 Tax=Luteolibacter sp. SL250 TaxID=2995170 RepID=UPI002271643A|nr:cytochrome c biogenesis protein CcsA [Luteolibacter sp. SL250]WAC18382.1 cytochrome c biogenesis protein CcsA [Luteolibacter sp. SL250]
MERWMLLAATLLALAGGVWGVVSVRHGDRNRWTVLWMIGAFLFQLGFLSLRGQMRGACPLGDWGERLAYLSWSLTLFYILVGPAYRISLLGVFTAPVVVIFQSIALIPGMLHPSPARVLNTTAWGETHSATSVLSYGAFALAAVAGIMFLVLDRQLKEHHLKGGLFKNLPPVRELLVSVERLLWLGLGLLTAGIIAGLLMPHDGLNGHFIAALAVWAGYAILLVMKRVRGLTGRRISSASVVLFVMSLLVFAFV